MYKRAVTAHVLLLTLLGAPQAPAAPRVLRQDLAPMVPSVKAATNEATPPKPRLLWTRQVSAAIRFAPRLVNRTPVVATSDAELVWFSSSGQTTWTTRLGSSAAAAPLVTSSSVLVLTLDGSLVGLSHSGQLKTRQRVWQAGGDSRAWLEQLSDGSTLLAQGPQLVHLDPNGGLRAQARLRGDIVSLATIGGITTTVDAIGHVYRWDHEHPPEVLGRARRAPSPAIGETLIYAADAHGIAAWNMALRRQLPKAVPTGSALIGPLALASGDTLWSRAQGNSLVRYKDGQSLLIRLGPSVRRPTRPLAPLVYGEDRVAYVSDEGQLGFWVRGEIRQSSARCPSPAGVTVQRGAALYACASGTVHALSLTE